MSRHTPLEIQFKRWELRFEKDNLDSSRSTLKIIDASTEGHPQGPLTLAHLNVAGFAPHLDETLANGRLMNAAPKLLAALDDCRGVLRSIENQLKGKCFAVTDVLRKAEEALAEATTSIIPGTDD